MKLTWPKYIVSNWSRTRFRAKGVMESSSTAPTSADWSQLCSSAIRKRMVYTFRCAAEQDINPSKDFNCFSNRSSALPHNPPIAPYATYSILPSISVLPIALALIDQFSELGTSRVVFDLVRRKPRSNVIAVGEQHPDQSHCQRRQSGGNKPYTRRIVHSCNSLVDLRAVLGAIWDVRNEAGGTGILEDPASDNLRSVMANAHPSIAPLVFLIERC